MATFVLRLIPLLLVLTVLAIWWPHWRRRTPESAAVPAICKNLIALTVAMSAQLAFPVLDDLIPGLPSLPHFLMHFFGMVAAFYLSAFAIHIGRPPEIAAAKVRLRGWLLGVALVFLTVFYAIGPAAAGLPKIAAEAGEHPWVVHYTAVYSTFLALALIDICWASATKYESERIWLRRGLRLLGIGAGVALLYTALRVLTPIVYAAGGELPWSNAGPGGVGTYLMLAGVALTLAGIALPPVGEHWDNRRNRQPELDAR